MEEQPSDMPENKENENQHRNYVQARITPCPQFILPMLLLSMYSPPPVLSLSILETSVLLWPCFSALLLQVLLIPLPFRPSRSALPHSPRAEAGPHRAPPEQRPRARSCLSRAPSSPAAPFVAGAAARTPKGSVCLSR